MPSDALGLAAHGSSRLIHSPRAVKILPLGYSFGPSKLVKDQTAAERKNRQMIITANPHLEHSMQEEQRRAMRWKIRSSQLSSYLASVMSAHAPKNAAVDLHPGINVFASLRSTAQTPSRGLKSRRAIRFLAHLSSLTDELEQAVRRTANARPLQHASWYPAQENSGKPMTVGDYGDLVPRPETTFNPTGKPCRYGGLEAVA